MLDKAFCAFIFLPFITSHVGDSGIGRSVTKEKHVKPADINETFR